MYTQNQIAINNVKKHFYKAEDILRKLKISELDWENFKFAVKTLKENLEEIEITDPYPQKDKELVSVQAPVTSSAPVDKAQKRKYLTVDFDKF